MLATPLKSSAAPAEPIVTMPQVPSAKALGKRRLDDAAPDPPHDAPTSQVARPPAAPVEAVKKQERRVTRSSLGGASTADREASEADNERAREPRFLPLDTRILLTTRLPAGVTLHPPTSEPAAELPLADPAQAGPPPSEAVANDAPRQETSGKPEEKPLFRLLDEVELLPPRGARHALPAEADTSDAFYLRLHRYPEVLEKRASRLERERLIHERSKLILELEELRGRTWVYAGTSTGGRAEEERQRKIREMEERLARYDALLPNQPRKSNFLNLSVGTGAPPATSSTGAPVSRRDSHTRTESPSAPVAGHSTSRYRRGEPPHRPPTPMSASAAQAGGGGTKIRIKFGAPSASASASVPASPRRAGGRRPLAVTAGGAGADEDDELASSGDEDDADASRYTIRGELRKGPKRDRRAERARAEERRRLGLPPRASIAKALTGKSGIQRRASGRKRAERRKSYADGDDDDEEEEEEDEETPDEEEEGGEGEGQADEWDGYDSETGRPLRRSASSRSAAPLVRKRLPDSFFHSATLRDAVMASHGPNARRASTRVAYAFGERLPDAALLRVVEFEPRGGVAGDEDDDDEGFSRVTLEAMVQRRSLERHGETMVLLDGRVLPKSALDVWRDGPLAVSPARRGTATATATATAASSAAPSVAASVVQDSASDAGSPVTRSSSYQLAGAAAAAAPHTSRSGASPSGSEAPPPRALAPPAFEDPAPPPPDRAPKASGPPLSLAMPLMDVD